MDDALADVFADGVRRKWPRGAAVILQCDDVAAMYLVTKGRFVLHRPMADGGSLVVQRAQAGDVLAEASAYARSYHCAAYAETEGEALSLPTPLFHQRLAQNTAAAQAWAAHLAHAVQNARLRAEISSLRGVEARLDAWAAAGRSITDKGHVQDLAAEIGVTREALYRALSRRRMIG
jgi:CRP-like cAMP-binding protein